MQKFSKNWKQGTQERRIDGKLARGVPGGVLDFFCDFDEKWTHV